MNIHPKSIYSGKNLKIAANYSEPRKQVISYICVKLKIKEIFNRRGADEAEELELRRYFGSETQYLENIIIQLFFYICVYLRVSALNYSR